MADEPRPLSRRERREAEARAAAPGAVDGQASTMGGSASTMGGQVSQQPSGSSPAASNRAPAPTPQVPTGGQSPEIQAGFAFTSELPLASAAAVAVPGTSEGTLSRRDRRRLERLEQPMETWTAEEEMRHTGQTPTMTPEVIAQQEALARQRAAAAQQDAQLATGGGATTGGQQANQAPATPGGVPASLQHLFPPAALQGGQAAGQQAQRPAPPSQPAQPSIDSHGRLVSPDGSQSFDVPTFADAQPGGGPPTGGVPQGATDQQAQQGQPSGTAPPQQHDFHAAAFEAMVSGDPAQAQGKPPTVQGKPPTIQVPQAPGAFQPPGPYAPPGMDGVAAMGGPLTGQSPVAPGGAVAQGAGQALVVPGTGTLRSAMGTGTIRSVPGTGTIPRPVVEVQPAGGLRHFGWAHLSLLAAAAFALGLVVYTVAAAQGH